MQKIELTLLRTDYLLGAAVVIFQLFNLQSMVSMFFYGTFIVTLLLWICTLEKEIDGIDFLAMSILELAFINVVVNGVFAGASFTFQYMKKYIMFCSTIVFFSAARKLPFRQKDSRRFEYLYLGICTFFILMYYTQSRQMHLLNGSYTRYLVFRFTNPNLTALFLSCIMMFLAVAGVCEKSKIRKGILFLTAVFCTGFVLQTESRNAIIVLCIFICLFVAVFLKKIPLKIGRFVSLITVIFPLIFAELYLLYIQKLKSAPFLSFIISEGKDIDSRVTIWKKAMQAFEASPVIGAYYQISNGTGSFQMHNTHLDILTSYGIVVLVLVCIFLYKLLRKMQEAVQSKIQSISTIAFMCALLLGMGEAALFSGGLAVYLYFGVFLLLSSLKDDRFSENQQLRQQTDMQLTYMEKIPPSRYGASTSWK